MKVVIQRAKQAHVLVDGQIESKINQGLVLLVGVTHDDTTKDVDYLAKKIINLRIFQDSEGKMNQSLKDIQGSILSVSQFTLYGDTKKGRRPNFMQAAPPKLAEQIYNTFNKRLEQFGVQVETGIFGETMDVSLINDGPVTLILNSKS